ncbi:MAG: hypothetical protein ACREHD_00620 [Pirellulales bacterium]
MTGNWEKFQRFERRTHSPHHVVAAPRSAEPAEQLSHGRARLFAVIERHLLSVQLVGDENR